MLDFKVFPHWNITGFFKVKMDMAAIETLSHEGLIQALINDVRSADETNFSPNSSEVSLESATTSSSKSSEVRLFAFKDLEAHISQNNERAEKRKANFGCFL